MAKTQEIPYCSQTCEQHYFYSRGPKKGEIKKGGGGNATSYDV